MIGLVECRVFQIHLHRTLSDDYWIGMYTSFQWHDGSDTIYSSWKSGHPGDSGKYCAILKTANTDWENAACSQSYTYVCQFPGNIEVYHIQLLTVYQLCNSLHDQTIFDVRFTYNYLYNSIYLFIS